MEKESRSYYFDLYKVSIDEVHKYHLLHHHRVVYFSGLITTFLGAASLALVKSSAWHHYLFSAVAFLLLVLVCQVGRAGIDGAYLLLLESISVRAKLEQALGLSTPAWMTEAGGAGEYWINEALVPHRHLEDRLAFKDSSGDWQNHRIESSDQRWTSRFLLYAQGLAAVLFFVTVTFTIQGYLQA